MHQHNKEEHIKQRKENLSYAVSCMPPFGYAIEFGVGHGHSLRFLSEAIPNRRIYAFDSFLGLPEDWAISDEWTVLAGTWNSTTPIPHTNVKYVIGWFADTIPKWKETHSESIAFMHIDCDLYSSTVTILTELNDQIVPDTIIVFDEIYESPKYKNWEHGEYKAFNEWLEKFDRKAQELNRTEFGEATFRILK
jgi:predicted O-methyltransferase YrrM